MSIIDYIKSLFSGGQKGEDIQKSNTVEVEHTDVYASLDKTPTLENVARFIIKTRKSKAADIQRYFLVSQKIRTFASAWEILTT